MDKDLETLISLAQVVPMTPDDEEKQRRSFAYGNSKIENEDITRELIEKQAENIQRSA